MDSLKFTSPAFGCAVELIEDVNNGIALTRAKWQFVEATAISVSETDAIRMRDWLIARYPVTAPQPEQSGLEDLLRQVIDELDALNCAYRDIVDECAEPEEESERCDATDDLINRARAALSAQGTSK